jgi:hypothetical protein
MDPSDGNMKLLVDSPIRRLWLDCQIQPERFPSKAAQQHKI